MLLLPKTICGQKWSGNKFFKVRKFHLESGKGYLFTAILVNGIEVKYYLMKSNYKLMLGFQENQSFNHITLSICDLLNAEMNG